MKNPFKFGTVVKGNDFINREETIDEIINDLLSGQSVIIYSERRIGKTSLIIKIFSQLKDIIPIYIDISSITSEKELAKTIVSKIIEKSYTSIEKIIEVGKEFLQSLNPKIVFEDGKIDIEISSEKIEKGLEDALDFPQRIAEKKNKRIIIAFDEFQEIVFINDIEKLMRTKFQMHDRVSYIFAGSKKHLIKNMFENKNKPFYKFGKMLLLKNIPKEKFSLAIKEKFEETDKKITHEIIEKILNITDGHPYYTQQICHELWYLTEKEVNEETLNESIENIISHQSEVYEFIWNNIKSATQKNLLIAICKEEENLYFEEIIKKYELKSSSHVQKSLKALQKKEVIENGKIVDVFFKEWLRRKIA